MTNVGLSARSWSENLRLIFIFFLLCEVQVLVDNCLRLPPLYAPAGSPVSLLIVECLDLEFLQKLY